MSSQQKGDLATEVVKRIHEVSGQKARTKVLLGPPGEKREFDVVLDVGRPPFNTYVVFECKNHKGKVKAEDIGAFKDKLDQLGIGTGAGYFVAVNGYQRGAKLRAKQVGITLLELTGLTKDRLALATRVALQQTIFLVGRITEVSLTSMNPVGSHLLTDGAGVFGGTIIDYVWHDWIARSSSPLGTYEGNIEIPSCWGSFDADQHFHGGGTLRYQCLVEGHVLTSTGRCTVAGLNALDPPAALMGMTEFAFDETIGKVALARITSEHDLHELSSACQGAVITIRHRVPRLLVGTEYGVMVWPPDDATYLEMQEVTQGLRKEVTRRERIEDLFAPPSRVHERGIRARIGAEWDPCIWDAFTGA